MFLDRIIVLLAWNWKYKKESRAFAWKHLFRPATIEEKRAFLLKNGIALWDVIASCSITGSADASIKDVTPNDLTPILNGAPIRQIFVNGKTAEKYYNKYTKPIIQKDAVCLPSTSPANAAWSVEKLIAAWSVIL